MMHNPWRRLPDGPPYVLPDDEASVLAYNERASEDHKLRIDELLPEPYLGNPAAPVLVLGNNPGYVRERAHHRQDPAFVRRLRATLLHEPSDYPLVYFAPEIQGPPRKWWEKKLKGLLPFGDEVLARSVFAVEYCPYPSRKYPGGLHPLASRKYSFWLVEEAMKRKAVIVPMRGETRWSKAVPGLAQYDLLCPVRNPQVGSISLNNCPRFGEVVQAIERAEANRRR